MSSTRRALLAAAAAAAVVPGVALAAKAPQTLTEAQALALQDRFMALLAGTDMDALADMMSEKLTYIHPTGQANTKKIQMDSMLSGPKPRYGKVEQKNTVVKSYPGVVIMSGDIVFTALKRPDGTIPTPNTYRLSTAYVDEGGTWRLLNWQVTAIAQPRPAAPRPAQ
jgi:hypothetical protein